MDLEINSDHIFLFVSYGQNNLMIVKFILKIIILVLKLLHKNSECFTSKPNAHGIF